MRIHANTYHVFQLKFIPVYDRNGAGLIFFRPIGTMFMMKQGNIQLIGILTLADLNAFRHVVKTQRGDCAVNIVNSIEILLTLVADIHNWFVGVNDSICNFKRKFHYITDIIRTYTKIIIAVIINIIIRITCKLNFIIISGDLG